MMLYTDTKEHDHLKDDVYYSTRCAGFEQAMWLVSRFGKSFDYQYVSKSHEGKGKINARMVDILLSVKFDSQTDQEINLKIVASVHPTFKMKTKPQNRILYEGTVKTSTEIHLNLPIVSCSNDEIFFYIEPFNNINMVFTCRLLQSNERKRLIMSTDKMDFFGNTLETKGGFIINQDLNKSQFINLNDVYP